VGARLLEGGSGTTEQIGRRPPAERELPRVLLIPGIVFAVLAFTVWIVWVVRHQPQMWSMLDLQIYQDGGREAAHGHNLYSDYYSWVHLPFTYPPFAALVFAAVSFLSFSTLQVLMTALGVVSLLVVSWLSWGKLGYRASAGRVGATLLATAFALCTEPVQQTLSFGQVNLILMLVVFGDLCLPDRWRIKGVGIGLAAGFKLVPAVFIPYLFLTRQFRAGFTALGAFAASILGCFLIIPHESRQYWGGLFFNSSRVGTVSYVGNQSMHGLLFRMLRGDSLVQPAWMLAALIVCVAGLLLAAWQYRRGNELLSVLIAATTGLLASPISWSHHWVWITVALILAAEWAWRKGRLEHLLLPVGLFLLYAAWLQRQSDGTIIPAGLIWKVPNNNNLEYTWTGVQILQGDMYTYIALLFFICLAVNWYRNRNRSGAQIVLPAPAVPAESENAPADGADV
jgi:alpha-1,2-mannosyltransferase